MPSIDLLIIASSDDSMIATDRRRASSPINAERTVDATTLIKSSMLLGLLMNALAPRSRQTFLSFIENDEVSTINGVWANDGLARIVSTSCSPSTWGRCLSTRHSSDGVGQG